jgi:hypothetical protein
MPTIVTYTPLQPPTHLTVRGPGKLCPHRCVDVTGQKHSQRLPLGSVRGVMYLDALCLHCGTHFVWVEDEEIKPPRKAAEATPAE